MSVTLFILGLSKCHCSVRTLLSPAAQLCFVSCWPFSSSSLEERCLVALPSHLAVPGQSLTAAQSSPGEMANADCSEGLNKDKSVQKDSSGKKCKPTSYGRSQCMNFFFHECLDIFFKNES